MKKSATFVLCIYASKKTVREAVKKGCFISAVLAQEEHKELADVHAVEFDPPEWSDEEKTVPEVKIGFREPKPKRRKRARR